MSWLRYASRHLHTSVVKHITEQLAELGWLDESTTPFGAPPVTVRGVPVINDDGALAKGVEAGTLAISLGDEYSPELEELGGGLYSQEYPIFLDCFGGTNAETLCLATDVRDILLGRIGPRRIPLLNFATNPAVQVPGWRMEMDDVERTSPVKRFPLHWHSVKVTATAYFQDPSEFIVDTSGDDDLFIGVGPPTGPSDGGDDVYIDLASGDVYEWSE